MNPQWILTLLRPTLVFRCMEKVSICSQDSHKRQGDTEAEGSARALIWVLPCKKLSNSQSSHVKVGSSQAQVSQLLGGVEGVAGARTPLTRGSFYWEALRCSPAPSEGLKGLPPWIFQISTFSNYLNGKPGQSVTRPSVL